MPIAAALPVRLSRGDDELIEGSCHGDALAAAVARYPSSSSALMNLRSVSSSLLQAPAIMVWSLA
jgi:hypothetical protein